MQKREGFDRHANQRVKRESPMMADSIAHSEPRRVRLENYRPPSFAVPYCSMRIFVDAQRTIVEATLSISLHGSPPSSIVLDGVGLELLEVSLDGRPLKPTDFRLTDSDLTLTIPGKTATLFIRTAVTPRGNKGLYGVYETEGIICTHCEPEGFRRITYFPDRPDVMCRFDVRIEADRALYPVLLANGNVVARGDCEDGRHWVHWLDPFPKPTYLFAFVAGRLDCLTTSYTTGSGRTVAINAFAHPDTVQKCAFAIEAARQAMKWDEVAYGLEYDLESYNLVVVPEHNFGAMENKGINFFLRSKLMAGDPLFVTDDDLKLITVNIAHEYFHNWSGNRVTCRDWFQLALKEGFTTFRHCQFEEQMFGKDFCRIQQVRNFRTKQFAEDSGAGAHPVQPKSYLEVSNFYTATVYTKGAEIVRMLRLIVGPTQYGDACSRFFERFDGKAATIEDFVSVFEEVCGRDLTQFRRWYHEVGTPTVSVEIDSTSADDAMVLEFRQKRPDDPNGGSPLHIPIAVGVIREGHGDMPSEIVSAGGDTQTATGVIELKGPIERFVIRRPKGRSVVSIGRGFSAPVHMETEFSDSDLLLLVSRDGDGFNRWDAAQQVLHRIVRRVVQDGVELGQAGFDALCEAIGDVICDESVEASVRAELITPPLERDVLHSLDVVDPGRLVMALRQMRRSMGMRLATTARALWNNKRSRSAYQFNPQEMGRRKLANAALALWVGSEDPEAKSECGRIIEHCENLTDLLGAIGAVNDLECDERDNGLKRLQQLGEQDSRLVEKWLQMEALSRRQNAAERVRELASQVDIQNVNYFQSLFGWFFLMNFAGLHARDGSGYKLLGETIEQVSALNATAAAWLTRRSDLVRAGNFVEPYASMMFGVVDALLKREELPRGVFEIVEAIHQSAGVRSA